MCQLDLTRARDAPLCPRKCSFTADEDKTAPGIETSVLLVLPAILMFIMRVLYY